MVTPATRAVVSVRFPFSDLSRTKLRPAVILADSGRDDWILCQVTSYARPGKLFTANRELMMDQVGTLNEEAFKQIIEAIVTVLRSGLAF